jgi:hypothetical protein
MTHLAFRPDEILLDVLDIPPHQSRSIWRGAYLQWEIQKIQTEPILIEVVALDVNGKVLARETKGITLADLKNQKA